MAILKGKITSMNTDIAQKAINNDFDHLQKQLDDLEFERKKKEFLLGFYKEQMQGAHPVPKTVRERYEEINGEYKKIIDNLTILNGKISSLKDNKNANEDSNKRRKMR
jgi:chromosome segregation ATPase